MTFRLMVKRVLLVSLGVLFNHKLKYLKFEFETQSGSTYSRPFWSAPLRSTEFRRSHRRFAVAGHVSHAESSRYSCERRTGTPSSSCRRPTSARLAWRPVGTFEIRSPDEWNETQPPDRTGWQRSRRRSPLATRILSFSHPDSWRYFRFFCFARERGNSEVTHFIRVIENDFQKIRMN